MSWLAEFTREPSLPAHCHPETEFLRRYSSAFHTCVPTSLAFTSNVLGLLSIIAWLCAQLPQIYKNWTIKSTSGLSIYFLIVWCLGDVSNLLGALFTHQASWQVAIGAYYVFVDLCLVLQWFWYEKLRHGHRVFRVWRKYDGSSRTNSPEEAPPGPRQDQSMKKHVTTPRIIFNSPSFQENETEQEKLDSSSSASSSRSRKIQRLGASSQLPSPSPRTVLMIACLIALAQASPVHRPAPHSVHLKVSAVSPTYLEQTGTVLSWLSTVLYLGSRLPQLIKNWQRKSTAGLSPHLFLAAFCGNLFYSSALLTNPCAWFSFGPYGGGGWAGSDGSDRAEWVLAALPFFLGAAGVLGLDGAVGVQFAMYGDGKQNLVVLESDSPDAPLLPGTGGNAGGGAQQWQWRRVSGWMRGWIPSTSEQGGAAAAAIHSGGGQRAVATDTSGYGTL